MVYLSVGCGELCLQICLSVRWLGVMFTIGIGFVCLLVGGYVITISFNSRDGVSVGLLYYRFKPIPWILSYKWADYWPYWEFIYLFFSMWPSVVMCITMGYLFHVWGGVGVFLGGGVCCFFVVFFLFCFVRSICTELLCFGRGI